MMNAKDEKRESVIQKREEIRILYALRSQVKSPTTKIRNMARVLDWKTEVNKYESRWTGIAIYGRTCIPRLVK